MPRTAAPSGSHASPTSACNGSERRTRMLIKTHGAALQGRRTALPRTAQRRTRRPLLRFHPSICRTPVWPSPRPSLCACAQRVPAECFCVQACYRRTRARNGGCCKQPVRAPVRDFAGRILSCAMCRMPSGVLPRRHRVNAIRVHACGRNERLALVRACMRDSHRMDRTALLCVPLSFV